MAHEHATRRRRTFALIFCSAAQLCALRASAEPAQTTDPTPAQRETARALVSEGDSLRASGDLRAALTRYQAAHAIMHVPTTGLELARVQAQLGLLVEARSTTAEVIHVPAVPHEPAVFTEARNQALALNNELETRVPSLKLDVQPAQAPYAVSVDGVALPAQLHGLAYKVNPGAHSVRVDATGYITEHRQVSVSDGETLAVPVLLTAQPSAAAPASVPSPARAALALESDAAPRAADTSERDRANAGRVRGIIGLGVGGAALIVGSVTGIMALSEGSDLKQACDNDTCRPQLRGKLSTANTLANVANISLPVGVLGVAYGLYELLTLPSTPPAAEHASALRLEITGTGAMLRGVL